MLENVDVCMPTYNSGTVIVETINRLADAIGRASIDVNRVVAVDNESTDRTKNRLRESVSKHDWDLLLHSKPTSLPKAREVAVDLVETDWFLFLDDDVRLKEPYFEAVREWTDCARVGAIQGRKESRNDHPADWVRRRVRRGGTHATLFRTAAVSGVSIPADIKVLEDEFLRRVVESRNYRWVLDPMAEFSHEVQDRHPIGWTEGYVGGKYALSQAHTVALNVPFAALTGRNPLPHTKRFAGWIAGRLSRGETANMKISRLENTHETTKLEESR